MHIVRYEDLMTDPEPILRDLISFVLDLDDITGTKAEHYINLAIAEKRPQNYKPRSGKINANVDKYSSELIEIIKEEASDMIVKLGY